jgi:hypothetical protein
MGVSGQRHAPAALLPPGKGSPVRIVQEAGWAPEPVWTQRIEEKSFAPAGYRNPIARSMTILIELDMKVFQIFKPGEGFKVRI